MQNNYAILQPGKSGRGSLAAAPATVDEPDDFPRRGKKRR
jgi:hypothetical protein